MCALASRTSVESRAAASLASGCSREAPCVTATRGGHVVARGTTPKRASADATAAGRLQLSSAVWSGSVTPGPSVL
eukprot:6123229-Prymnesium_polylepis.1